MPVHIVKTRKERGTFAAILSAIILLVALWPSAAAGDSRPAAKKILPPGIGGVVTIGSPVAKANPSYLGIAIEMDGLCDLFDTDAQHKTRFENLFRSLGPVVLKVAGKASDFVTWEPNGKAACSTFGMVLTDNEIKSFFSFAQRANLHVVWGLPLAKFNPKAAAAEAKYVASVAGSRLVAWTMGNEPDLYVESHFRSASYSFKDYYSQWTQTRAAVAKAVPNSRFIGPEQCCVAGLFNKFAASVHGKISAIDFHQYAGSRTDLTADHLLSSLTKSKLDARVASYWSVDSKSAKVPMWITETNTFPLGGVAGVSDAFGSALWLSDFLFDVARSHVSQVDVQEINGNNYYDPIDISGTPRPIYYGLLLYHAMVPAGSEFLVTKITTSMNVTSYADRTGNGRLNVLLVNKGPTAGNIVVTTDRTYSSASDYSLQAPGLAATTGITLGGNGVSSQGIWSGPDPSKLAIKGQSATVHVPGDSAVSVTFRNAPTLTITANNAAVTYGGEMPTFTFGASGFINGDTAASLTTQPTCASIATRNSSAQDTSPVGGYTITCSGAVDPNYSISYESGTLTISPAPLTITPTSITVKYGQILPKVSWSANFVNGDSAASLSTQPTCTTTVQTRANGAVSSPAGTYPITCKGAAGANYSISYASGSVTVSLAHLSMKYAGPTTLKQGSKVQLAGYLSLTPSYFVAGRSVVMTLGSGTSAQKCTTKASTTKGYVSCAITKVKQRAGKDSVTMTFSGDARGATYDYGPEKVTASVTIKT